MRGGEAETGGITPPSCPKIVAAQCAIVGLRAEHLLPLPAGKPGVNARAVVVETLGADTFVYFDFDGARRVARVMPEQTPRVGDVMTFGAAMGHAHLFDAQGHVMDNTAAGKRR
jgi:ABC-type sugar transport system ATPase subunit